MTPTPPPAVTDPAEPPPARESFGPPQHGPQMSRTYRIVRRAADLAVGVPLALVLAPVVAVFAVLVKRESPGDAFYTQTRVGEGGKTFRIIKIRTMRQDAEADGRPRWSPGGEDPRITKIGKFLRASHIDEFPQIVNVLRGEMTLIGPRPERPEFVDTLVESVPGYELRLNVKPGVTGLAQLRVPPDQTVDDVKAKVAHDVYYIEHLGPWLDARVSLATLRLLVTEVYRACGAPLRLPSVEDVRGVAARYIPAAPPLAAAGVTAAGHEAGPALPMPAPPPKSHRDSTVGGTISRL